MGGAFLALVWPRLRTRRNRVVALAAAAVALGMVPLSPAGVPVLAAAGVAVVAGLLTGRGAPAVIWAAVLLGAAWAATC